MQQHHPGFFESKSEAKKGEAEPSEEKNIMSLLDLLTTPDNPALVLVLEWLGEGSPYCCTELRATCRAARAALPKVPERLTPNGLRILGGLTGNAAVCRLAKERGAKNWGETLIQAAARGDERLCRLAREWGATDIPDMISHAAIAGHENICRLGKEWGATHWDCNCMLYWAVVSGHERLWMLAIEWGATSTPDDILMTATQYGRESLCRLCRERGATKFDMMLLLAAQFATEALCMLAVEWGATDYNKMLFGAAEGGNERLCRLARTRGATDWNGMLLHAKAVGFENICRLAREWGATV